MNPLLVMIFAALTSAVGALGGLGGAVILVPLLVLTGMTVAEAAPIGLASVAALSIAAAPEHLRHRMVNHRLGLTTEVAATGGAVVGAILSDFLPEQLMVYVLAAAALSGGLVGGRRKTLRNRPDPSLGPERIGEHIGSLSGAYPLNGAVVPYQAVRVRRSMGLMAFAGAIAGIAGVSGGFVKTPAMSELMHVPTKVAAATTTFTIGITAAAALAVFAAQGRIDSPLAAAGIAGSLLGSIAGVRFQARLQPATIRQGLSVVLVLVAVVLVVS